MTSKDPASQSNGIPLKQLVSDSQQDLPNLRDEDDARQNSVMVIVIICVLFAAGVTVALIIHICISGYLVLVQGVVVSDHQLCSALGQKVLDDHGSSVDAAISATMCLGVVHPHVTGMGGGGVMLVHDLRMDETRVIHFQGTAPKALKEQMLQSVSDVQPGLQVGVPAMLRGLIQAHRLYGRLSWVDVVRRAAHLARDGVNVSQSLFEAILKVKGQQLSQHFRDLFLPDGKALQPGSVLRIPGLAEVLEADPSNFYNGNLSEEMEEEVWASGGVLSREDMRNYSAEVTRPLEGLYHGFKIQVPPPPSVGAALISALNVFEGFQLENSTEQQTYHWVAEALKAALVMASSLGDSKYDPSVHELLSDMLSKSQAQVIGQRINASHPSPPELFSTVHSRQMELKAGQVLVMGPDDLMVSVSSSLNRPFGSRIITQSGIILNSLILDFSWPNKTKGHLRTNQRNRVHPGQRPLSPLMPTIVVPSWRGCGLHMALSSSDIHSLSAIAQVLISELSSHKKTNGSLSLRGVYPELQPDRLLVDSEFLEDGVQFLLQKGHMTQRVETTSVVQGIQRNKDIIKAMPVPQISDTVS
ncbi:glutathione hydrolase 7-like [Sphaeramia orbicularis]|uniref:glutathione hydrolase 7-like n=1 Tax=Sphaeramia orbicularis TaxID=375764 RepID=UPI00117DF78A|nr:glutathione hydrolase 7-like [Sphaeramia orbicularis]